MKLASLRLALLLLSTACFCQLAFGQVSNEFQVDMKDIQWLDDTTGLLLSYTGHVYRSTDTGMHWTEITDKLPGSGSGQTPGFLYPSTIDHNKVYIRGDGSVSWVSSDKGSTWQQIKPNKIFRNLDWHPTEPTWAIASVNDEVWFTSDFGITWKQIRTAVYKYAWGDAGSGTVPKERIYLIVNDNQNDVRNLAYTDDWGAKEHILQPRAETFLFLQRQVFILTRVLSQYEYVLKVSPDIGRKSKHFFEAEFPFGDQLDYNGYAILDDTTGAVYLGVNHGGYDARWGNIYVSEARGWQYATAVKHASQNYPFYDFAKVEGLDGIYISNIVNNWDSETATSKADDQIITLISHDNGGFWSRVNAPHFDANHQPIACTGSCSLHLHGYTSLFHDNFGPFYSTHNAIGLIVATGNTGDYLDMKVENTKTYMSRDAGVTWQEVYQGSTIYEIGDHGSIVVFAPFDRATTSLFYTLDQASTTLQEFTFSQTPVDVENIVTEPSSTNERFLILGRYATTRESVVISVDFSQVFTRTCGNADYESWAPDAGRKVNVGLRCLLGRDVTYRRRRADARCFNGDVERVESNITCPCLEEDYECDYEYERVGGQCVLPAGTYPPTFPPEYCPPGSKYYKSNGYRKVAGDGCVGGIDLNGAGPFDCPADGNSGEGEDSSSFDVSKAKKSRGWIAAVVLVPIVFVLLVGAVVALRSETLREKLPFLSFLTSWRDGYVQTVDTVDDDQFIQEEEIEEDAYTIGDDDHSTHANTTTNNNDNTVSINANNVLVDMDDAFDPRK